MKRLLGWFLLPSLVLLSVGCRDDPLVPAPSPLASFDVAPSSSCYVVPPGLVSWWPGEGTFDDVEDGNSAVDVSGVTFDAGVVGQGFSYAGTGKQFIEIADAPNLHLQTFTLEMWAIKMGPGENELDKYGTALITKSTTPTPWPERPASYYVLWRGRDNKMTATVIFEDDPVHYGSVPIKLVSINDFPIPTTLHVALTWDGNAARLYVNGALEAEHVAGSRTVIYGPGALVLGSNIRWARDLGWLRTHNGVIDEVGIFDRALSQSEIQGIYEAGSAGKGIDAEAALTSLITTVQELELQKGLENALSATLTAALNSLVNDRPAAIQQLEAFINQVEALRGAKLNDADADALIAAAQRIIDGAASC